jgi:proteasome lid subunit RPN8/RPN11
MAADSRRFRIDDGAHIRLRRDLRRFDPALSIVGLYHSHPNGLAAPSPTDVAESHYPEWVHVIVALGRKSVTLRAFRIARRVERVGLRA